jgi:WD40-like Beta Propeller Repeat
MKRSWTALAVAGVAVLAVAGCNDYGNTFQNNTGATITSISPSVISAGSGDFSLTVNGGTFVKGTVVQWNGKTLDTTLPTDSAGNILGSIATAKVPAALVANSGVATIITLSPAYGAGRNGLSNPIAFVINPPKNPQPTLTTITPNTAIAGAATMDVSISLTGMNFLTSTDPAQATQVTWTAGSTPTQLAVSGTPTASQISATIPLKLLANPGTASVTVFNPGSSAPPGCTTNCNGGGGGGSSAPHTFKICAAAPCTLPAPATATAALVAEETPAVSLDGRYVAYIAVQNEHAQVFLRDTCEGAVAGCQSRTTLLSVAADGSAANEESHAPSMSSDGRYVAFSSAATNVIENAPAGRQVYLRDTCAGAGESCKASTSLISADSNGALVGTESILPSVSSSGRFVAFLAITPSHSSQPISAQTKPPASAINSGFRQVFIRDTCLGAPNCTPKTIRVSFQPGDGAGSGSKPAGPALSGNAKHVAVAGGNAATLFTRSVAVDDRVFLAITGDQH